MKKTKTIHLLSVLLGCGMTYLQAQNGVVASGGQTNGSGGSVSYSIGQTNYILSNGSGGAINQGLQQVYSISTETGLEEKHIQLEAIVFPNPSSDFVMLSIENTDLENLFYTLLDQQGKCIAQRKINSKHTGITLLQITSGMYFLKISNNSQQLKTFKIIKN